MHCIRPTHFSHARQALRNTMLSAIGLGMAFLLTACGGGGGDSVVSVVPKAWGTAAFVQKSETEDAQSPQFAVDAGGNVLAVWAQSDGATASIWANRFTPAAGWGTAERIQTKAGSADKPRIVVDASGNGLAVWQQFDGVRGNIVANRFTPAAGWGTSALIEAENLGSAEEPQIAMDASGNALAVWSQGDGTRANVWANRFTPVAGWGTAELIESSARNANRAQIAIDASGNALAMWMQSDGARYNVVANRFTPATGWGTAVLIESEAGEPLNAQIAMDASGNALAVWMQEDGTRYNIWANRFTPAAGWGTAELVETNNAGSANSPQVAIDASGKALAVWVQEVGLRTDIWANRFIPGTGWGTPVLIETDDKGSADLPKIAMDANGNALAVWAQSDGTRPNILANRFTPAAGWGTAVLIESGAEQASSPQITFDTSGNAWAVWQQSDGTRENILANRFK